MTATIDAPEAELGRARLRKEDAKLITGQTNWTDNIRLPGMLHVAFVRSPFAHAKITNVDVSGALGQPGVIAAFSGADEPPSDSDYGVIRVSPLGTDRFASVALAVSSATGPTAKLLVGYPNEDGCAGSSLPYHATFTVTPSGPNNYGYADQTTYEGMSGGPLIDEASGTCVGMLKAARPGNDARAGGFAVPSSRVAECLDLRDGRSQRRARLIEPCHRDRRAVLGKDLGAQLRLYVVLGESRLVVLNPAFDDWIVI